MSFAYDVKKELCAKAEIEYTKVRAEYYALLLFCKKFSANKIVFTTEHKYVARRFINFSNTLFTPIIERRTNLNAQKSKSALNTLTFIEPQECERIFTSMGHSERELSLRLNRANIESDEAFAAFVRGAFLACGSVTDPEKNYHLEFSIPHKNLSNDLCKLLSEINEFSVAPKVINRNGVYVVYIKDSEEITDLLTYMGATSCAMQIMGTKAMKQVRNNANRIANSEFANLSKIANASAKHLDAIRVIDSTMGLASLPPELYAVAMLRNEYPEMSLRDIGAALDPPISRSGVNHRMEKILAIAETLKSTQEGGINNA